VTGTKKTATEWVPLGYVVRAHGLRGALRIKLFHDESDTLRPRLAVRFAARGTQPDARARAHSVVSYAPQPKSEGLLVIDGVADKDAADAFKGSELFVARADFSADDARDDGDEDDVYLVDLIGAAVVREDGSALGRVARFEDNGAQPLVIVARAGAPEVAVPYVPAIVIEASPEKLVLRPPGGLFDDDAIVAGSESDGDRE
jgi:16S rRNA processing protein RimM